MFGGLAQVVEQPVHTRYVPGSSPGTATPKGGPPRTPQLTPAERTAPVARVRRAVATAVDRRGVLRPGEAIVVACSGGPDSTALLDALARLGPPRGWRLTVAHVDHGLRAGSAAEADIVASHADRRGLDFTALSVSVPAGGSLQDRARSALFPTRTVMHNLSLAWMKQLARLGFINVIEERQGTKICCPEAAMATAKRRPSAASRGSGVSPPDV